MAVKITFHEELDKLKKYLLSESNEDAKRHWLYPLFQKLYKEKFKIESDAKGADGYVEGKIIIECKSDSSDWLKGFYQALHYQKRYGLAYSVIIVIAHKFIGVWHVNKIPEHAFLMAHSANPMAAPNIVGKENARKTQPDVVREIIESAKFFLEPKRFDKIFHKEESIKEDYDGKPLLGIEYAMHEIFSNIRNSDAERWQIDTQNFIENIEQLKRFFDLPIDAVHAFYTMVAYWDITSTISTNEYSEKVQLVGFKGKKHSDYINVNPSQLKMFQKFVESRYVFTNEGSGITADNYFSRFDEVMARIDPEYVIQHGIFFTDSNLSKFALWFAKEKLGGKLDEQYIFFDPAGGSGNLISSWRGKLKHKIISELQPDLLRIIERRLKVDPFHEQTGFTIIPKTSENKGLNFLDCDAAHYVAELDKELKLKNLSFDKPLAFLLNPPYKNTDEHQSVRESKNANYQIDKSILELTGNDAGNERYLAFLGQILNIAKLQNKANPANEALVLIFTPTSWLIPRPTYVPFRQVWDRNFSYVDGFIVTSNEFFKLKGKWPLAFTIWKYNFDESRVNRVELSDYTHLKQPDLKNINWMLGDEELKFMIGDEKFKTNKIQFGENRVDIRQTIPILYSESKPKRQTRFDFSRAKKADEVNRIVSGFPLNDKEHHLKLSRTCGYPNGEFVGFMDDNTPVRLKQEANKRLSNRHDRIWFRLDNDFKGINKIKVFNGPPDNRGYCAYSLETAKVLTTWFSIAKSINGIYPTWANQSDIWAPEILPEIEDFWYALCFAFVLAENRCVVTKFEANNPVPGAPEVFVDNPLCPANPESFWATTLDAEVKKEHGDAFLLVQTIKRLYKTWNLDYCHGQFIYNTGLKDEPYFRYFSYPDFLTPYSGLIQIRKYAEQQGLEDLLGIFAEIQALTKKVREEIYQLLVKEFRYFG